MSAVGSILAGTLRRLETGCVDVLGMCICECETVLGDFAGEVLRVHPVACEVVWVKVPVLLPAQLVEEDLHCRIVCSFTRCRFSWVRHADEPRCPSQFPEHLGVGLVVHRRH